MCHRVRVCEKASVRAFPRIEVNVEHLDSTPSQLLVCHGLVLQVEGLFFVWAQIGMSVFVVAYFTVVMAHSIRDNNQFELRSVGAIQRRLAWPPR